MQRFESFVRVCLSCLTLELPMIKAYRIFIRDMKVKKKIEKLCKIQENTVEYTRNKSFKSLKILAILHLLQKLVILGSSSIKGLLC